MPRQQLNVRVPETTISEIEALTSKHGYESQSHAVIIAIRDLFNKEETRTMTIEWHEMNWNQATAILADRNSTQEQRHEAAQRIQADLDRQGDDGLWDWILEGDWTGDETPESVKAELAEIEEA